MRKSTLILIVLISININFQTNYSNSKLKYGIGIITGLTILSLGCKKNIDNFCQIAFLFGKKEILKCFEFIVKKKLETEIPIISTLIKIQDNSLSINTNINKFINPTLLMLAGIILLKCSYDRYPAS